ncbi:MAG: isocitrate dehydrogenase [Cycloclasticus sp. symbiont of Poecilosclerida sp. M]|nr:MAG: isocitrate dehydrogenase [Cycloclasticus sp. symbiont of Poecilosclerida sp. M]
MAAKKSKIIYTLTDEAPLLATASLLPIIETFTSAADIEVALSDISLASRILAAFSDKLKDNQKVDDALAELGRLTQFSDTNIIKLPNISASIPQLKLAISELQDKGYNIPDFPESPSTKEERATLQRYEKTLGSAVNPVLREGNSDRRAPRAVKDYARKNPHSIGKWSQASRTHVSHMHAGDFYCSEKSLTLDKACNVKIEFVSKSGDVTVLKENTPLLKGEIIDSMFMSKKALCQFLEEELEDARETGVMFSFHVKATMMKVSHPIVFGHAVKIYYKDLFEKHGELFDKLGVNPNDGLSSVYDHIETLPASIKEEILADMHACYETRPELAMVDSAKGISNLHTPNEVIVDASMPAMIRSGGKMWGPDGKLKDTKAVMPESTFARIYQEIINFCKTHGAFDPTTMGSVPNVGLMAQKAEEYGSHDKTFEMVADGSTRIVDEGGNVLLEMDVEEGDIWRMCQVKDAPIQDWVKLAVSRACLSGTTAVFWLDEYRPHEFELIKKVRKYLEEYDLSGLDIHIMSQQRAMRFTLERIIRGKDTISVTGNILRDYLTDLFPILELGTSAKMLSIVPLMAGGGLFETGAGGSAPKHVKQLTEENHLRWDSLGEFLALGASLEDIGQKNDNVKAMVLAKTLDIAVGKLLENGKSPSRKTGELDNRGSHFYLALYWAQALVAQTESSELQASFKALAKALLDNEQAIVDDLTTDQWHSVDLGGYFLIDEEKMNQIMRPSKAFNDALASMG